MFKPGSQVLVDGELYRLEEYREQKRRSHWVAWHEETGKMENLLEKEMTHVQDLCRYLHDPRIQPALEVE